jgi:TorA maturation chaperone TorD
VSDLQAARETAGPDDAAIDEALARAVLYHALTLGLRPPAPELSCAPFDSGAPETLRAAATLLDAHAPFGEALLPAVETFCDRAASPSDRLAAHARLFGHSRGLVCPFETEYGGQDGAFRQPQELADIAGTYLAFGLEPPGGGDERVDHAACECEFMDFLARKEAFGLGSLRTSGDQERARELLATVRGAARGFLREHLGRFGRAFASRLIGEDAGGFHGALGALLFRFLAQECQRFGLPPGPPSLELRPPLPDDTPMACGRTDDEPIQIQGRPRP